MFLFHTHMQPKSDAELNEESDYAELPSLPAALLPTAEELKKGKERLQETPQLETQKRGTLQDKINQAKMNLTPAPPPPPPPPPPSFPPPDKHFGKSRLGAGRFAEAKSNLKHVERNQSFKDLLNRDEALGSLRRNRNDTFEDQLNKDQALGSALASVLREKLTRNYDTGEQGESSDEWSSDEDNTLETEPISQGWKKAAPAAPAAATSAPPPPPPMKKSVDATDIGGHRMKKGKKK